MRGARGSAAERLTPPGATSRTVWRKRGVIAVTLLPGVSSDRRRTVASFLDIRGLTDPSEGASA